MAPTSPTAWQLIGQLSTIGMSFVLALVIGFGAGYWLDGVLGTKPWLSFVGFFLGLAAGVLNVYREIGSRRTRSAALVKFFTRHAIVALAAYGMMVRLHLDAVGLLLGVTSLGVAVGVEALRDLRWRRFL